MRPRTKPGLDPVPAVVDSVAAQRIKQDQQVRLRDKHRLGEKYLAVKAAKEAERKLLLAAARKEKAAEHGREMRARIAEQRQELEAWNERKIELEKPDHLRRIARLRVARRAWYGDVPEDVIQALLRSME